MGVPCRYVEARNQRPNPDLERLLAEGTGGPSSVYDWVDAVTGEVLGEGVPFSWVWQADHVGFMWLRDNEHPMSHAPHGGPNLYVVLPGGITWNVDSRATNCGRPEDDEHHCWVRHGDPPNVSVDKDGGTCEAGGGSIAAGDYHGFLTNGELS